MQVVSFLENRWLTKEIIISKLSNDQELFDLLVNQKILRVSKEEKEKYRFEFVGTLLKKEYIINIFPKIYNNVDLTRETSMNIIKLFVEYSKRETLDVEEKEFLGFDEKKHGGNIINLIDFILEDYLDNGLYIKNTKKREINGLGEINWTRTIDNNSVIIQDNTPIYYEMLTERKVRYKDHLITLIHMLVINMCLNKISEYGLQDILKYDIDQFENDLDIINDLDFMIEEIEKELDRVYNDRNIKLLSIMLLFLKDEVFEGNENEVIVFGTRNFEIVWEKINSFIFNNQYKQYNDEIPNPIWICNLTGKSNVRKTIVPDIINVEIKDKVFNILDAKYYSTDFKNGQLIGTVPGTEDIMKQLVYEDFYKQKYNEYSFTNSFIIPTRNISRNIGSVHFPISNTNNNINVIHMNIDEVIKLYIDRDLLNIKLWREKNKLVSKDESFAEKTIEELKTSIQNL